MLSVLTTTVITALNSDHINSNYASMKIIMSSKSRRRLAIKTRSQSGPVPTHPSDGDTRGPGVNNIISSSDQHQTAAGQMR